MGNNILTGINVLPHGIYFIPARKKVFFAGRDYLQDGILLILIGKNNILGGIELIRPGRDFIRAGKNVFLSSRECIPGRIKICL